MARTVNFAITNTQAKGSRALARVSVIVSRNALLVLCRKEMVNLPVPQDQSRLKCNLDLVVPVGKLSAEVHGSSH